VLKTTILQTITKLHSILRGGDGVKRRGSGDISNDVMLGVELNNIH